ncbi:hypothetical protein FisN_3Lh572 [Fistulifera solaris]|uniref:EXS domain-containing protein n=1 Tax=Fistulifera solaris TaxID=1519565 RepID=A0A1Z5J9D6_FISSO|nr:hypothetical protein FisN_3Lh572 [Fistulifera solaris]|eukprot:GAX10361.1 hypothetical protein FisN_3Lh572 [Fistulifera solaris]
MTTRSSRQRRIARNVILLACMLLALGLLSRHSIFQALRRHEPSARIFRAFLEIQLILLGTACSLYLWSRTIGAKWIGRLLFFSSTNGDLALYARFQNKEDDSNNHYRDNDDSDFAPLFVDENTLEELSNKQEEETNNVDILDATEDVLLATGRSSTSSVPTAADIFQLCLDNLLLILVALFLFSWSASGYTSLSKWTQYIAWIAAPTFPLLLFLYGMFNMLLHKQHRPLWSVLACTLGAPLFPVTFRDGFVGDVLTSSVRPMQDITFTLVYLLYGLQGWWSQSYAAVADEQLESTDPSSSLQDTLDSSILLPALEKSWILHTILLPFCVIGPLWWRFLQNLRQVMDERRRWPYLGNAFKYFFAAQVAVTGVYYPNWHGSTLWLTAFVVATLYQIYWDIFMDWGLLERSSGRWRLRSERLYNSRALYWSIASINVVLRFCWTLTFIPPQYLNPAGILIQQNKLIMSPFFASAEIVRRTLWGWLRFEYEALKVRKDEGVSEGDEILVTDNLELAPMEKMDTAESKPSTIEFTPHTQVNSWNDMASLNDTQVLLELSVYAVTFLTLWLVAVAHRSTQ